MTATTPDATTPDATTPDATKTENTLIPRDRHCVWHPYSNFDDDNPLFAVTHAEGVMLHLEDGRKLIDGMASWWSAIHGYNHPKLNKAAKNQIDSFAHVMFGGLTHRPAIELCELLVDITPAELTRVFLSDSGSVSVEVALKMAAQYWLAKGQTQKTQFLAFERGYHGDTLGAMSVTDPTNGMHSFFNNYIPQQTFAPAPQTPFSSENTTVNTALLQQDINAVQTLLEQHHQTLAGVIIEPIVQGAGGMRFYHPELLSKLKALCEQYEILLIADEIATGFGRSGRMFACEHASISPDILCVGKALTGGYVSLAATLCSDNVANTVCGTSPNVLMHGPTFMANPLSCAIAHASISLLLEDDWQTRVLNIQQQLTEELAPCKNLQGVADVRVLGAIGVVELERACDLKTAQPILVDEGVWVRPFGKLVYIMPPYIISKDELSALTTGMYKAISKIVCL